MPKKISEKEQNLIMRDFLNGKSIEEISKKFNCTKNTITRRLKKRIGENQYKQIIKKEKGKNELYEKIDNLNISNLSNPQEALEENFNPENSFSESSAFMEIAPLNFEIDNLPQKDLSSVHIEEFDFPNIVYMVVDKKIELEIKYLREFPEWQFLSKEELNRKTIEIFVDLKVAKRSCSKEQKVIKVPNTNVFKIVAPLLIARGISRIVSAEKLIAL